MLMTFGEICGKEIINIFDGKNLGFADDLLFDGETRKIAALIIRGKPVFFGFFGREEDISVPWEKIKTVGRDTILINCEKYSIIDKEKENFLIKFLNKFFIK